MFGWWLLVVVDSSFLHLSQAPSHGPALCGGLPTKCLWNCLSEGEDEGVFGRGCA
ncbi:hypothetical protein QJS10_CPB11g00882 [Acorus calamus]|uniref:Uncharacterized protein n=1 Tax=Acorus calamus TaxID=4465 RepID=A0AAV9DTW8_ACOCL|nr:hypothetical protein QJS10_CPB11g00882 [Acorus calamus]